MLARFKDREEMDGFIKLYYPKNIERTAFSFE